MNQPDNFTALALVESLIDNPFYQSVTIDFDQDPVQRRNVLASYFQYSMAEARRTGRCVVGPASAAGAALWSLPRPLDVEIMESAAKKQFIATVLGPRGVENYHRIVEFMSSRIAPVVPSGAWYLSILGVHPMAQARGAGARLLVPTMAEAKAAKVICYLETFAPRSLPFYERIGFKVVATHLEPTTNLEYYILRQDT